MAMYGAPTAMAVQQRGRKTLANTGASTPQGPVNYAGRAQTPPAGGTPHISQGTMKAPTIAPKPQAIQQGGAPRTAQHTGFAPGKTLGAPPVAAPPRPMNTPLAPGQGPGAQVRDRPFAMSESQYRNPQQGQAAPPPAAPPGGGMMAGGVSPGVIAGANPIVVDRAQNSAGPGAYTVGNFYNPAMLNMNAQLTGQGHTDPSPMRVAGGPGGLMASTPTAMQPGELQGARQMGNTGPIGRTPADDAADWFRKLWQSGGGGGVPGLPPGMDPMAGIQAVLDQLLNGGGASFAGQLGGYLTGQFGQDLSQLSGTMTDTDIGRINDVFGWQNDQAGMRGFAGGLLDPSRTQAWEDAARADLQSNVNRQRDEQLRMLEGRASRGGAMSSGAMPSVYQAAQDALSAGERGLAQDSFDRELARGQVGSGILNGLNQQKYDLLSEGFTSNPELMNILGPILATMFGEALPL